MKTFRVAAIAAVARLAIANPVAQGIDLDAVADLPPPPSVSMAVGVDAQTVTVDQASLIASVVSAMSDTPLTTAESEPITAIDKRQASSVCSGGTPQATGSGPVSSPDTAAAFAANPVYGQKAVAAPVPAGYTQVFKNLTGSSSDYGYLGYSTLTSYDTNTCAARCSAIKNCHSFNIYYERDPSVDPGTGTNCLNPPSTTNIKCVYWGAPISSYTATNTGQWRANFQVLIAGSNGYVNYALSTPAGYTTPSYLGNAAINAPLDCNGDYTYMGFRMFQTGAFDPSLCAAACTAASNSNIANPPANGKPELCTFFNTYMLYKNNKPQAQYCALYNETWNATYATNVGQYDSSGNHITIGYSYVSSNTTNPGVCTVPSCSPGQCGTYQFTYDASCGPFGDCICGTDVNNAPVCIQDSFCGDACSTNADCGAGSVCFNGNSCCGYPICAPMATACPNAVSPRRLFRVKRAPRGGPSEKRALGCSVGNPC